MEKNEVLDRIICILNSKTFVACQDQDVTKDMTTISQYFEILPISQYFWNSADTAEFHVAAVYFYGAFEILPPRQNSLDDSYVKI